MTSWASTGARAEAQRNAVRDGVDPNRKHDIARAIAQLEKGPPMSPEDTKLNRLHRPQKPTVRDALEAAIAAHAPEAMRRHRRRPAAPPRCWPRAPRDPRRRARGRSAARQRQSSEPALPAPASWKAGLREHWKTLAPDVQAEIHRREGEQVERMRENAAMRQPHRAFQSDRGAVPCADGSRGR